MSVTVDDVLADGDWDSTWGLGLPGAGDVRANRSGRPEQAIAALLHPARKNTHLANGDNHQTDGLPVYLPGNGGLLSAVALMAAGWDGGPAAPGFPAGWTVRCEGVQRLPR